MLIYNYRKTFGLSYQDAINDPFEEVLVSAKIEELISEKDRIKGLKK